MPFPASLRLRTTSIALFCSIAAPAMAVQVTDNLDLGGAIRARWDVDPDRDIQKFGLDTVFLSAKYNSDTWIGERSTAFTAAPTRTSTPRTTAISASPSSRGSATSSIRTSKCRSA